MSLRAGVGCPASVSRRVDVVIAGAGLLLAGCGGPEADLLVRVLDAPNPLYASAEEDAKAKSFVVRPDKANLYVYRNESLGSKVAVAVALNGKVVGKTAMRTYMMLEVDPGEYDVTSISENTSALALNVEAGYAYLVRQEMKMGATRARSQLHRVDEQTGRNGVREGVLTRSGL